MNKLAFRILSKIVSEPGIDRKTLVSDIQRTYPASPHDIAIVIANLRNEGLLTEGEQGFQPVAGKTEFYQKMQPFSDDVVLDLMIKNLNKPGGSPNTITHLNSDLKLYLNREDSDYYEALLTQNDFVKTTYPDGSTFPTFFISDIGKINLRKFGGYLEYLEARKPKPKEEDIILKCLASREGVWHDTKEIFAACGIDATRMRTILAVLSDKIDLMQAVGEDLPHSISITEEGLKYLNSGKPSEIASINYIHNDHSTHTHGNNSQVLGGNVNIGHIENGSTNIKLPTPEKKPKKITWGNIWGAIGALGALAALLYEIFKK